MVNVNYENMIKSVENYFLMVPYKKAEEEFNGEYAIIFDDWDVINELGKKSLPELSKMLFNRENTGEVV